jgi:hypothetical protein
MLEMIVQIRRNFYTIFGADFSLPYVEFKEVLYSSPMAAPRDTVTGTGRGK